MTSKAPTTDQLRSEIDRGDTGEKIGFPDPAAAPLGTDDEAAGHPPTPLERNMAASERPLGPHTAPGGKGIPLVYLILVVLIGALILATIIFASTSPARP